MHIPHIAPPVEFALAEDVADVPRDDRPVAVEQLGHLRLGQPDRVIPHDNLNPSVAIGRFIDDHRTARLVDLAFLTHDAVLGPSHSETTG